MTEAPRTRALLVYPRSNADSFWSLNEPVQIAGARSTAPPLGLLTMAAMLPATWECRLIDRSFQELTEADLGAADIVMTGGMISQDVGIRDVIAMCNAAGVPVAVGGPSPTSTPEAYGGADFLVLGEAEGILPEFISAWERGERRGVFTAAKFQADVTKSPAPRYDLIDFSNYMFVGVQFSRGCPFTCEFCDIIELYGRSPRTKTAPQVLAELDRLHALGHRGHVDFVDDNLIGNKKAVKLFLPHLVEWQKAHGYPFHFSTEASLNLSDDAELLDLMRQAGFFLVFVGIESPDEETLVATSKKQNTRRSIAESVHRIYDAGIFVIAGFIVGFDTDKPGVSRLLSACIEDTAIPMAMVGTLTALPNTQLHRRLRREGRLFENFAHLDKNESDAALGGLNFQTLRPRRDVLQDFRDTVAAAYAPAAYFGRVQRLARLLDRPRLSPRTIHWPSVRRDARALGRALWRIVVRHPELRWPALRTIAIVLRHNPRAFESILRNVIPFIHHHRFTRHVVREIDARIAAIDSGAWIEPVPLPPAGEAGASGDEIRRLAGKAAPQPLAAA